MHKETDQELHTEYTKEMNAIHTNIAKLNYYLSQSKFNAKCNFVTVFKEHNLIQTLLAFLWSVGGMRWDSMHAVIIQKGYEFDLCKSCNCVVEV